MTELIYGQLLGAILRFNESQLDAIVAGQDYSIYFMPHGVMHQGRYHAGQIAMFKKKPKADL